MTVEEYRNIVHEDMLLAVKANASSPKEEFLLYTTGILINGEEFDDFNECYFEGVTRRNGNMRIDGYSMDETDGSCCLFISEYYGPDQEDTVKADDISSAFRKIRLFVEEATRRELYLEMTGSSQAIEFARDLFYDNETITKYRFYFLTDAFNRQRAKSIKDDKIGEDLTLRLGIKLDALDGSGGVLITKITPHGVTARILRYRAMLHELPEGAEKPRSVIRLQKRPERTDPRQLRSVGIRDLLGKACHSCGFSH